MFQNKNHQPSKITLTTVLFLKMSNFGLFVFLIENLSDVQFVLCQLTELRKIKNDGI